MSEATAVVDHEPIPELEPVAEFLHDKCSLELEALGPGTDVYTFIDEPPEEISDHEYAENNLARATMITTRDRARHIFRQAESLGIRHYLEAAGFRHDQPDDDEDVFTVPRAQSFNAFQECHPDLVTMGWVEQSDESRYTSATLIEQVVMGNVLLNDGRADSRAIIYGYHDHVEHGPGYALLSPVISDLVVQRSRQLFGEYFDAQGDDADTIQREISELAGSFDRYTTHVTEVMIDIDQGSADLVEKLDFDDKNEDNEGLLVYLAPVMETNGLTREDIIADIAEHTQRLRDFQPEPDLTLAA